MHQAHTCTKRCNHAHLHPTLRHGVPRISLTVSPGYGVAGVYREPFEKLLRYLKLATSSKITLPEVVVCLRPLTPVRHAIAQNPRRFMPLHAAHDTQDIFSGRDHCLFPIEVRLRLELCLCERVTLGNHLAMMIDSIFDHDFDRWHRHSSRCCHNVTFSRVWESVTQLNS